ncbi:MAG: DUF4013 domain-containing protein [Anaerolineales bacterium]|nr:DUF4013 domain-containing protein [Anaerolineales bacterium]
METLDYGRPFTFPFQDRDWPRKILIASLLVMTIVGITPVMGWTLEVVRRLLRGEEAGLPAWKDFGPLWRAGFRYWLVNLAWLLPLITAILLPVLPLLLAGRIPDEQVLIGFGALLCCAFFFLLLYSTAYLFLLPAMTALLADTGSLRRALNPANAWRVARPHFIQHLLVLLIVAFGLLTVVAFLAPLTLLLGLPAMLVYTGLVSAHFAGQLYRMTAAASPAPGSGSGQPTAAT